jgi:hypothetical protein
VLINTSTEEQAGIASVHDLEVVPEFNEVGLMLLVTWSDEAVDFAFQLLLLVVIVGAVPFGQPCFASALIVSRECKACGSRNIYWRFWMRMNESTIAAAAN